MVIREKCKFRPVEKAGFFFSQFSFIMNYEDLVGYSVEKNCILF